MKNICNNCGHTIPDDVKFCPNCGAPLANAPFNDEKKFWEKGAEGNEPSPPIFHESANASTRRGSNGGMTPPPFTSFRRKRNRTNLAIIIIVATSLILILIMCIIWVSRHSRFESHVEKQHTTITHGPGGTQVTITTGGDGMTQAQADSLIQSAMAEMAQTDSIMQAMMNSLAGGLPMPGVGQETNGIYSAQPRQQHATKRLSKHGMVNMAGRIGQQEIVMVLNLKDPQNVKGSGDFIKNGKEQRKLHMLGIQDGENLTVSIYNGNNKLVGTLVGILDDFTYEGSYLLDGKETPFRLLLQ